MDSESSSCHDSFQDSVLMRTESFKSLLLCVSQRMTETNVRELRFAAEVHFDGSIAIDLLSTMRDRGVFGPYCCVQLEELLKRIGRYDLADMVTKYMIQFPDEERAPSGADEFELESMLSAVSLSSQNSRKVYPLQQQPISHHFPAISPPLAIPQSGHRLSRLSLHSGSISHGSSAVSLTSSPSRLSLNKTHSRTSSVSYNQSNSMKKYHIQSSSVAGQSVVLGNEDLSSRSGSSVTSTGRWVLNTNYYPPHLPANKSQSFSGSPSVQAKKIHERVMSAPASSPDVNNPRYVDRARNPASRYSDMEIESREVDHSEDNHSNKDVSSTEQVVELRNMTQSQISDDVTPRSSIIGSQTRYSTVSTLTEKSTKPDATLNFVEEEEEGQRGTPPREKSLRQKLPFFRNKSRPNSASSFLSSPTWKVSREELIKPIWQHQSSAVLTKPGKLELDANCGKHNPKLTFQLHPNGLFQDAQKAVTAAFRIATPEKCPLLPPSAEVKLTLTVHSDGIRSVVLTHTEKLNTSVFYLFGVLTHEFLKESNSKHYNFNIEATCTRLK